jgi:hypothetical protein
VSQIKNAAVTVKVDQSLFAVKIPKIRAFSSARYEVHPVLLKEAHLAG